MLGLGNWVENGKIYVSNHPLSTFSLHLLPSSFTFFFLLCTSFYRILIFICTLFRQVPLLWNSFASVFLRLGIVQCFVFLGFLSLLENFGLATPIPVGIKVLGVKTPLRA